MAFAFGASISESFRYRLEEQFVEAEVGSIDETELPEARSDPVSNEVQRSLTDDPWIERGGGFRAIAYSGPGSSIDVHSHDLAADQTMMRVYGHVDDDELPVAALKAALFHDRSSLIRISNFDEIVDGTETGALQHSNLFVLSRAYYGSAFQSSKLCIDSINRDVSVALTLTRKDFSNRGWRAVLGVGWIMTDLPAPELRLSLRLAVQGYCLIPNEACSMQGANWADQVRVESMRIRECAVLMHIGLGLSDSTIARELGLSSFEIHRVTTALYKKLSVTNRAEVGAFYIRFRDEIVAHRKSLIQDTENHSPRAALRSVEE